ncbi:MAG: glycosyltransferase family 4 protein [Ignavibacterium album]|uniref:glycosyltransferase family 4 protein n=1 Tax=Ignavibacterium album TaxID=591197 RepID=UPI0026EDDA68|nr:glycosyltransferase family 4 protein [Ignavibacterium album]MCX8104709.1 glycosyltransferase family 4 protein [Ignavibacterium album]
METSKKRFIFLLSHPIQYFSPLFVKMAKEEEIDLLVLYCSDENVKGHIDKGFGVEVKWDIPLLEGYNYKFLKNNSWKPSIFSGFFGLINLEILKVLKNEKGSILVNHGWSYLTNYLAIITAKIFRLKLCLRAENPLNQELTKSKMILFFRKLFFKYFFFKLFDYFFYIGQQNKKLYEYYGVSVQKLVFTPYCVDNKRFSAEYFRNKDKKIVLRKELGLPVDKKIILTSGKYIEKKRPMDLLKAYHLLNDENTALVFVGEGELRREMEDYIKANDLKNVYLTGFKNQSEVGKYFAAADIFVLPSGAGETWGLVVNEAMNFGLPIISSDLPGSAHDLVKDGENGFVYKAGDLNDLLSKINTLIHNDEKRINFGIKSLEIIQNYSYEKIIENLKNLAYVS